MKKSIWMILLGATACAPAPIIEDRNKPLIENIKGSVDSTQSDVQNLYRDIQNQNQELDNLQDKYNHLEKSVSQIVHSHKEIQQAQHSQLAQQSQIIKALQTKLGELGTKLQSLDKFEEEALKDLKQFKNFANETDSSVKHLKEQIHRLEVSSTEQANRLYHLKNNIEMILKLLEHDKSSTQKKSTSAPPSSKESSHTYKVKSGDTLEKIAKSHKTTVENLRQLNHLKDDKIIVGQILVTGSE